MSDSTRNLILLLCLQGLSLQSADAFDWTANDIQLLYGTGFEFGDDERTTITVEDEDDHGWQYGTNYFFIDISDRNDIGAEIYAEVYSYMSLNKLTGYDGLIGPVKDVSLVAGLNISNKPENDNFKTYLLGLSFDLGNFLFDYL